MPLTVEEGRRLLEELIAGYQEPDFQRQLSQIYYELGDDEQQAVVLKARRELTMAVQANVLPKYGFDATHLGVHRSFVEYQKPPLVWDAEIAKLNVLIDYFIRKNPMARARERKVQEEKEEKRKRHMDKRPLVLSVEDGMCLLDELIAGYQDPDFQRAQMLINKLFSDTLDERDLIKSQRALCMTVQAPVLPKYGFEATQAGVHKSWMAYQVSALDENTEIQRRNALIGYLCHACPAERARELMFTQAFDKEEEEELPAGRRRRGGPLLPCPVNECRPPVSLPLAACVGPQCAICRAVAVLIEPDHGLGDQVCQEHDGSVCPTLVAGGRPQALNGSIWESVSLAKFFPPPIGAPPMQLLSAAEDDDSVVAPEEGLGCPSGFRIWPSARLLLEALEEQQSLGRVLELGAGTGVVSLSLASRGAAAEGTLLTDSDARRVKLLRANASLVGMPELPASPLTLGEAPECEFDTVLASDVLQDPAVPGQPLQAPEVPGRLLDTVEAALRGPAGGRLLLAYQHRHPTLIEAFITEAARRGAVVREVLSDWVPDADARGELAHLSVYHLEYQGFWRLPSGPLLAPQLEVPTAIWASQNGMVQHQVSSYTKFNRHPEIFSALQALLTAARSDGWAIRILSFGCSDGSECRTMRMYFPQAAIDGLDIDAELIRKNRESNNDQGIQYFEDLKQLQEGSYDAVLMMTVLCRYGDTSEDRLAFEVFDQTLAAMDRYIRLNGYFVIYNANYLFSASSVARRYENVALQGGDAYQGCSFESGFVTKYSRAGKKISSDGAEHPWVFFQKRSAAGGEAELGDASPAAEVVDAGGWSESSLPQRHSVAAASPEACVSRLEELVDFAPESNDLLTRAGGTDVAGAPLSARSPDAQGIGEDLGAEVGAEALGTEASADTTAAKAAADACGTVAGADVPGAITSAADDSAGAWVDEGDGLAWGALLQRLQVYALAIPARREHIRSLLNHWGFQGGIVVDGIQKDTIDLADWEAMGKIKVTRASRTEHGSVINSGRVACHFGHRRILRDFLDGVPTERELALIFEDDLVDQPAELVQQAMLKFFREVPEDFDILHLGYLWEDASLRQRVGHSEVFRTCKAVGRHAYVVTKKTASMLLAETYPQTEAGDQMYIKTIQRRCMQAYQPSHPIFCQDRGAFPISELTGTYRPARNFRPPREEMKKWNRESRQAKAMARLREHERLKRKEEEERAELERRRAQAARAALSGAPLGEPTKTALARTYQVAGTWDDWKSLRPLSKHSKGSHTFEVQLAVGKGRDVEFQLFSGESWQQRYFPAPGGSGGIMGPFNGGHGSNWAIPAPEHPALLCLQWDPTGSRSLTWVLGDR